MAKEELSDHDKAIIEEEQRRALRAFFDDQKALRRALLGIALLFALMLGGREVFNAVRTSSADVFEEHESTVCGCTTPICFEMADSAFNQALRENDYNPREDHDRLVAAGDRMDVCFYRAAAKQVCKCEEDPGLRGTGSVCQATFAYHWQQANQNLRNHLMPPLLQQLLGEDDRGCALKAWRGASLEYDWGDAHDALVSDAASERAGR